MQVVRCQGSGALRLTAMFMSTSTAALTAHPSDAPLSQAQPAPLAKPSRLACRSALLAALLCVALGPVIGALLAPDVRLASVAFLGFALVLAALMDGAWLDRTLLLGLLSASAVAVADINAGYPVEPELRALAVMAASLLLGYMLARRAVAYRAHQRRLLDLAAEQLEQLRSQAMHDELTGVFNRRQLMAILGRQKALADRGALNVALVFADLDHFKRVNDEFGHVVGDQALHAFAEVAETVVRSEDFVARFGGEEFVLVLVNTDEHFASQVAGRLAERTRALRLPGYEDSLRLSVSCGVTQFRSGESVDALLRRADAAMYAAKSAGRDRVMVAAG